MYIENKPSENASVPGLVGVAHIERVTFSMGLDLKPIFMPSKLEQRVGFPVQRRTVLMDFTGRARRL
jgi:hypothetical protein